MDTEIAAILQRLSLRPMGPLESLGGGMISRVDRVSIGDGRTVVVKRGAAGPPGLFESEAEGLSMITVKGGPKVPAVLDIGADHLVLEDVGPPREPAAADWEACARRVAAVHAVSGDAFGAAADGFLGRMPQLNGWWTDGFDFFVNRRILCWLNAPRALDALDRADRRRVETVCGRIREIAPDLPPALTHGDLWAGNMLIDPTGTPAWYDPAACFLWGEVDLAMAYHSGGLPEVFFDAYREVRPYAYDWERRWHFFHLRELLSMVAHFGDGQGSVGRLRATLDAIG